MSDLLKAADAFRSVLRKYNPWWSQQSRDEFGRWSKGLVHGAHSPLTKPTKGQSAPFVSRQAGSPFAPGGAYHGATGWQQGKAVVSGLPSEPGAVQFTDPQTGEVKSVVNAPAKHLTGNAPKPKEQPKSSAPDEAKAPRQIYHVEDVHGVHKPGDGYARFLRPGRGNKTRMLGGPGKIDHHVLADDFKVADPNVHKDVQAKINEIIARHGYEHWAKGMNWRQKAGYVLQQRGDALPELLGDTFHGIHAEMPRSYTLNPDGGIWVRDDKHIETPDPDRDVVDVLKDPDDKSITYRSTAREAKAFAQEMADDIGKPMSAFETDEGKWAVTSTDRVHRPTHIASPTPKDGSGRFIGPDGETERGHAVEDWEHEAGRWDKDPDAMERDRSWDDHALAARHAMRRHIDDLENRAEFRGADVHERAAMRDKLAALYYDHARADRLLEHSHVGSARLGGKPDEHAANMRKLHRETAEIARNIATKRPKSLDEALAQNPKAPQELVGNEYLLWRHSTTVRPNLDHTAPSFRDAAKKGSSGMRASKPDIAHIREVANALDDAYGNITRDANPVTITYRNPGKGKNAKYAGFAMTTGPQGHKGHIVMATSDQGDNFVKDLYGFSDRRNTIIHEMAHSLSTRGLAPEYQRFNKWMRGKVADAKSPHAPKVLYEKDGFNKPINHPMSMYNFITTHGINSKNHADLDSSDRQRGRFQEDWAIGLADHVLDNTRRTLLDHKGRYNPETGKIEREITHKPHETVRADTVEQLASILGVKPKDEQYRDVLWNMPTPENYGNEHERLLAEGYTPSERPAR